MMKKKFWFTFLLAVVLAMGMSAPAYAVGSYGVDLSSKYYYSSTNPYCPSYSGQCTWYCWGRAMEKCGINLPSAGNWGNAQSWYEGAQRSIANGRTDLAVNETVPRENSIAVFWGVGSETVGIGHVYFVEKVEGSTVYCSESNYLGQDYHEDSFDANERIIFKGSPEWEEHLVGYIYFGGDSSSTPEYSHLSYSIANGEVTITGCDKSVETVEIPDTIKGYPVTSISYNAFNGCTNLTSITIPNSVTSIGNGAFEGCTSLTSISIPNSVTSIGRWVFSDCTSLTNVNIPNSVTFIGDSAFSRCSSLTSITIPDSITSIGGTAFLLCKSLTNITIPDSVTSIGRMAFQS